VRIKEIKKKKQQIKKTKNIKNDFNYWN
jgi:hypothetical protein